MPLLSGVALAKTLRLVIPGLLGPWPERSEPDFPLPQARDLERLLGWALSRRMRVAGAEETLFDLFGLSVSPDKDLPVAAVTRLADGGDAESGWWLRADPVHLEADRHQVLLRDARNLAVSPREAQTLVREFNQTFAADGLMLFSWHAARWYLRLPVDPGLRTVPLMEAAGRDISSALPTGRGARRWRTLLTEVQMLFHASEVNQERESRGLPAINGIWFWGGGLLPTAAVSPAEGVYAEDLLTRGLVRLAGAAVSSVPPNVLDWFEAAETEATSLVVLEATRYDVIDRNPQQWSRQVGQLERDWFSPCRALLKHRELEALYVYPGNGWRYVVTPRDLLCFWRRRRPLWVYC